MSVTRAYTLWASMKGEEPAPWLIAAEDENTWEGNPARCEEVFQRARDLADKNGWDVREIVLLVPYAVIDSAFLPVETEVTAEPTA